MAREAPKTSEHDRDVATIAAVIQTFTRDRQAARRVATGHGGESGTPGWRGTSWRRGMF